MQGWGHKDVNPVWAVDAGEGGARKNFGWLPGGQGCADRLADRCWIEFSRIDSGGQAGLWKYDGSHEHAWLCGIVVASVFVHG